MRHARLAEGLTKLATDHGHTMAVTDLLDAASIIHSVPQKISELATLRAELAAAKEDSARLDAIQRGNWTVHYRSMHSRWEVLTDHAHPAHRKTYTGKTARAAIDAARKGEQDAK